MAATATTRWYLGIDVSKRWHDAALLDANDTVCWRLKVPASRAGLRLLEERLAGLAPTEVVVGLEATGVYWITLHAWLVQWGARVLVLNPLQTRAFRNASLRGGKSDELDAVSLARLVRWSERTLSAHVAAEEQQAAAREISRLRTEMMQLRAKQLVKLDTILERIFPEFRRAFPSLSTKSARAVLARWPTPALVNAAALADIVAALEEASRGRVTTAKAEQLRALAAESIGVADPLDAAAIAIRTVVDHLTHLDEQIHALAGRVDALLVSEATARALLETIPGLGPETVRTWLAEMPPVERFRAKNGAERLVAATGLDAQVRQSGQYTGKVKMSKRGNRYARRALVLAARAAARTDPYFAAVLRRQLLRGKHYNVAASHVARKLVHVIYSVLIHQRPYEIPPDYRLGIIDPEPAELLAAGP
jgi:transposase